jgi:hypothetical protein
MANYQTGALTEAQVKLIHEALVAHMDSVTEEGDLQKVDDLANLQETFGDLDNLIRLDD